MFNYLASKVWFDNKYIYTCLLDGHEVKFPLIWFPRLYKAAEAKRNNFELNNGYALHWPMLDEDLSIEGFLIYKKNG
jgi:hypothetical protein